MKNGNLLIALIVGGVIGFVIGKATTTKSAPSADSTAPAVIAKAAPAPAQQAEGPNTVYAVPVTASDNIRGPATAKVTMVEWSDFQCPFCGRAEGTLKQIFATYGDKVRLVFKQYPLPFHQYAGEAAEASLAAAAQGKFWPMHDAMYANQQHLTRADLDNYAKEVGLDVTRFDAELNSHQYKAQVLREEAQGTNFGVHGTPTFFVNGHKLVGAQPFSAFKTVIDQQIAQAEQLSARGVPATQLYAEMTKNGATHALAPAPSPNRPPPPAPGSQVQDVTDLSGPTRGAANAKVTIVEWSDFQCPFCGRAEPVLKQIFDTYGKDVRLVWKNQPLPFHPHAMPAATAAMAVYRQGNAKFWKMHDEIFADQGSEATTPDAPVFQKWAQEAGANVTAWKAELQDPKVVGKIHTDMVYGRKFGANGTPTFFIDGREIPGAMPFPMFKTIIDDELKKADALLAKGVSRHDLYAKLLQENLANAPKAPLAPPSAALPTDNGAPVKVAIGDSPVRGNPRAPVTIVTFSDYQCPFCSRAEPTVQEVLQKYGRKVKFVFKNYPLPFHPYAMGAAEAAEAAGEQGKYWQMHDLLFKNNTALTVDDLDKYASEIGLNVTKFKAAMDSPQVKAAISQDQAQGSSVGVDGTPTFFINGHKLVGAQPLEAFTALIDKELAKKKG